MTTTAGRARQLPTLRVTQHYTGGVRSEIVRMLATDPRPELVGVSVHGDDKAGRDTSDVTGISSIGTTHRTDDVIDHTPDTAIWSDRSYEPERPPILPQARVNVDTDIGAGGIRSADTPRAHRRGVSPRRPSSATRNGLQHKWVGGDSRSTFRRSWWPGRRVAA